MNTINPLAGLADATAGLAALLRCPVCQHVGFDVGPGFAMCGGCSRVYGQRDGVFDVLGTVPRGGARPVLAQRLMETRTYPRIYERLARPAFTYALGGRSIAEEMEVTVEAMQLAELGDGARVLDIACGPGLFARRFAQELRGEDAVVVGLDLSRPMLDQAARHRAGSALDSLWFVRGDALALPLASSSFDRAHVAAAIHFIPDVLRALAEMARVLAPGGVGVISTYLVARNPLVHGVRVLGAKFIGMRWFHPDTLVGLVEQAGLVVEARVVRRSAITLRARKPA